MPVIITAIDNIVQIMAMTQTKGWVRGWVRGLKLSFIGGDRVVGAGRRSVATFMLKVVSGGFWRACRGKRIKTCVRVRFLALIGGEGLGIFFSWF